ncbi:hypothetical protein HYV57_04145 [Candidatus Peregrinibacteria bacterium]|nr:hypothetical protein [Candidatus Peregrinibacteria bacterium]
MPLCKYCQRDFEITTDYQALHEKVSPHFAGQNFPFPLPSLCPDCRQQRRLSWRNERNLYKRLCDFSKKNIISVYSPDKPYKVYDHEIWWSDQWDARSYGQPFDFKRPFFEQFHELQLRVPRMNMILSHCENSNYAPYSVTSRNCYMCVSVVGSEDIYYSYQTNASRDCVDCSLCYNCEICLECIYGVHLYRCFHTNNCRDSSDLLFCRDCSGCDQCVGCVNLTKKRFHIFNSPVSETEYHEFIASLSQYSFLEKLSRQFRDFALRFPVRASYNIQCEHVSGDHLLNCKNSRQCFEAEGLEDCSYIYTLPQGAKDCFDAHYSPKSELVYEAMSAVKNYHSSFILHSWDLKHSYYTDECFYSSNLFGCIGLKKNEYCILNKQYSKEQYENLVPRIMKHMMNIEYANQTASSTESIMTGSHQQASEWGEYFPTSHSLFAYNETIAPEFFPLKREEVLKRGWQWREDTESTYSKQTYQLPDDSKNVSDTITSEILSCRDCGRNYRIIPQELAFYRKLSLPIPRKCSNCRHKERMQFRAQRHIWKRMCFKCGREMETTYSPDRSEKVYCESCYLKEIY